MDYGGRDTVLQDAYDIGSLIISMETVKQRASSLKCSPVTSGPSEPRREMQVFWSLGLKICRVFIYLFIDPKPYLFKYGTGRTVGQVVTHGFAFSAGNNPPLAKLGPALSLFCSR
jgi:hypothetical protein